MVGDKSPLTQNLLAANSRFRQTAIRDWEESSFRNAAGAQPQPFGAWLCRKKDSWMCGANCRQPVGYRRWFGGDRLLFRKHDEQLFNLALLVRLGKAGSVHFSIMPLDLGAQFVTGQRPRGTDFGG